MPHEFVVGVFEPGDDDMGDFMLDIWLPFARDDCNWVDNQAPVVGTRPEIEVWTHRGTESNPEGPFYFVHTKADSMQIFGGADIDVTEEIYDQPNNPGNDPRASDFNVPTSGDVGNSMRTQLINSITGPYQGYWLFCDTTGEYIYCVIKVSARQYRHFHVGKLRQIDGGVDLDPQSAFTTCHFWSLLDPAPIFYPVNEPTNGEHSPYGLFHMYPFRQTGGVSPNGAFSIARLNTIPPIRFYMPGLHPKQVLSAVVNDGGTGHAVSDVITVSIGTLGSGTPAQLTVLTEAAGVILTVSVTVPGDYDREPDPTTAITQASTTGSGVNATFDLTFEGYHWYQAKPEDTLQCAGSPVSKSIGTVNDQERIGVAQCNGSDAGLGSILMMADANFTANANVLVPIYVAVNFDFQSDVRLGAVAQIPDVFRINMRDYSPEQTITVQGVDYKVFPLINDDSANVLNGEGYSAWEGLAYRVETGAVV